MINIYFKKYLNKLHCIVYMENKKMNKSAGIGETKKHDAPSDEEHNQHTTLADLCNQFILLRIKRPTQIGCVRMRKVLLNIAKFCGETRKELSAEKKSMVKPKEPKTGSDPVPDKPKLVRQNGYININKKERPSNKYKKQK